MANLKDKEASVTAFFKSEADRDRLVNELAEARIQNLIEAFQTAIPDDERTHYEDPYVEAGRVGNMLCEQLVYFIGFADADYIDALIKKLELIR